MAYFAGIDLGGTKIAAVILEGASGKIAAETTVPTRSAEGPEAVIERMAATVTNLAQEAGVEPDSVGLGVPATIDSERGVTLSMPNLPGDWAEKPVTLLLGERLGRPVWLVNDARAFTLAEATLGAGRGAHTVIGFTLGTGIGGGVAIGGRLHLGLGNAGEFGHLTVDPYGPLCGCGNYGCLESLASGPAIAAMGVKTVLQGNTSLIGALVEQDANRVTPAVIMRAAELGDFPAQDILQRAGMYLGIALSNMLLAFSPDRVIIGGGVAELGDWILAPARATIRERCKVIPIEKTEIRAAALGRYAGALGAAVWAMQRHQSSIKGAESS